MTIGGARAGEKRKSGPASWTARTWFGLAVLFWLLYGFATGFGAAPLGIVFLMLAIVSVLGLGWRLLDGR